MARDYVSWVQDLSLEDENMVGKDDSEGRAQCGALFLRGPRAVRGALFPRRPGRAQ